MSTVLATDDEATVTSAAAEALIEAALRRQHRRRWWRAMAGTGVALTIGLALACGVGGAGHSTDRHLGSSSASSLGLLGRRVTIQGSFVMTWGTATGGHHKGLSGTVRVVGDTGHTAFTTKAVDGHWKVRLPAGNYSVQGLSTQVPGERRWSTAVHLVVRSGQTDTSVRVAYYIPTG